MEPPKPGQLTAQEIAVENSVPLAEVLTDIDQWRAALGKWTRTVEALYKLCSSSADWAALKLEPTEKRVIKKKCEEVFAQIQAQQTPTPQGPASGVSAPSTHPTASTPSTSTPTAALPVIEEPKTRTDSTSKGTVTPGGPDGGLPQRIKVPMKGGSETKSRSEEKKEKRGGSAVSSSQLATKEAVSAASSATLQPPAANVPPHSPVADRKAAPAAVTAAAVSPAPSSPAVPQTSSPAPATMRPPAGATDLSVAITKIFEIVKQKAATELRLSGKQLERQHLKLIFDCLLQTNTVSHVELRQASLGDEGASLIAKFLKSNKYPNLTSIDLSGNPFKASALEELVDAVSKNFYITTAILEQDNTDNVAVKGPVDIGIVHQTGPSFSKRLQLACENNKHLLVAKGGGKELRMPGRSLTDFPEIACSLTWLTILDLNTNDLSSISFNIESLRNLERLILNKNQLETLPAQVGLLPRLVELNLSNNILTALPPAIGLLASLEELNVSSNRLTELPRSLGGLLKLKALKCQKNPWKKDMVVPKNVISKGDDAVLAYLRNLFTSGEAYMNRMKLMFVGNGNVGKTSLLAAFKKQKQAGPNVATDGIDISQWAPDERITFNAWDFAGQEVYYATHAFFLSPQAIYILVFNMLDDEHSNKIEYWLRSIHARAGKPPVVLVGTHLDEMSRDAGKIQCDNLQGKWQAQFKNIELVTAVSTVNGKGIKELQKELVRIAMKQKWMDKTIPKNYLLVQQKIEALKGTGKAPWLDWSAYRSLILECGVSEDDVAHVTDFLVNLGDIAKTPNVDKVVLDSQWLTKAFATIITMKTNFVKDGLLNVSALQHLWSQYPPDISQYLVALFERYELIYKIDDQTLLVPSMLKEQRPAQVELDRARFAYSPESELGRIYQLDFVPTGLFSRIVVRLLSLRWKPNILWRYGFVLSGEECCVLLEMDLREQLLKLYIRGIHIQRNLILFTDGIQSLLKEWMKLKYKIFVPCSSCNSHRYTLVQLDEAVQAGKRFIICPSTRAQVRLDAVVPDITMSQLPKIEFCDLMDLQLIGKGSYASVYKCTWKGRLVAVKQVTVPVEMVDAGPAGSVPAEFRREVWLMSGLKHRNFVQLYGVSQSPLCFVMEYCSKGSLAEFLSTCGKLDWARRLTILEDVANGMNYLHQHNPPIVHRDLKSPNVLLSQEGSQLVAKVGDVGIAQGLLVASRLSIRGVDCPVWVAPEILSGSFYNEKSDVYSYAIILWEVLTQSAPFGDSLKFFAELEKRIIEGTRPVLPDDVPPAYRDLIMQCWDNDPRKRPAFTEVLEILTKVKETVGGPSTHVDG